jgi:hypothetical protein
MPWVCALQMIHIESAQLAPLSLLSFLVLLLCSLLPSAAAAEADGGCWQAFNQRVKALKRDVLALYYAGGAGLLHSVELHVPYVFSCWRCQQQQHVCRPAAEAAPRKYMQGWQEP